MTRTTLTITDTADGRVQVEIAGDRDLRTIPEGMRTRAEDLALRVYAELDTLARHGAPMTVTRSRGTAR